MKIKIVIFTLFFLLSTLPVKAETDYLSLMAEDSEIKAIAVVTDILQMGANLDGTIQNVTFKTVYGVTPYIPKTFIGACKTYDYRWQRHSDDIHYFKPRKGQKVYVTVTTNGGAITSYTPLTEHLETVLKKTPNRVAYSKGTASVATD